MLGVERVPEVECEHAPEIVKKTLEWWFVETVQILVILVLFRRASRVALQGAYGTLNTGDGLEYDPVHYDNE